MRTVQSIPPDIPTIGQARPWANALETELKTAINGFVTEHDVTWAEVLGVLEILKLDAYAQMRSGDD